MGAVCHLLDHDRSFKQNNLPKFRWRDGVIEAYKYASGNAYVPRDESFFTLGGLSAQRGRIVPNCELDQLTRRSIDGSPFILAKQYVSVERKDAIHRDNVKIAGPTWRLGGFAVELERWLRESTKHVPAIVSADFMCGAARAIGTIRRVLDTLLTHVAWADGAGVLVAFNVTAFNRGAHVVTSRLHPGWTYPDTDLILKDASVREARKMGCKLIDRFRYRSTTVGATAGMTEMETLIFWWKWEEMT